MILVPTYNNGIEFIATGLKEGILPLDSSNVSAGCNCAVFQKLIAMRTTDGNEPGNYPVTVYDINLNAIGVANTKDEFITLWNQSPDNNTAGTLSGESYPFTFLLTKNVGPLPDFVYGDPIYVGRPFVSEDGSFVIIAEDGTTPIIAE